MSVNTQDAAPHKTNAVDFDANHFKRSRAAYMAQSAFEYFLTILVGDAFLAKL